MRIPRSFASGLSMVGIACAAATTPGDGSRPSVALVDISPSSISARVGASVQLSVTVEDSAGNVLTNRAPSWSSSDTTVAQISKAGMLSARAAGAATIHATVEGKAAVANATIIPVPVASISISPLGTTVAQGVAVLYSATTRDSAGNVLTGRAVGWSSSNTLVATISSSGVVTTLTTGTSTITAASEGVSAQTSLTVSTAAASVASVTVSLAANALTLGQTTQASATLKDSNGNLLTGPTVTWSSSDTTIATVSASGVVTAVARGSVNIVAISEGKSGSAVVSVSALVAKVDTLFVDHFDSGTLGDAGRWQDIVGTGASIVNAAAEGITAVGGSQVLKLSDSGAAITHFVSTAATSPYEHLYLSFRMLRTSAYQGANPGLRAGGIRGSTTQWGSFGVGYGTSGSCPDDPNNVHQQEFMFAYVFNDPAAFALRTYTDWIGEVKFTQSPPTCGGNYALAAGSNPLATYYELNFVPTVDVWHQYEIEVQLNDVGQSNGWQRMWVDGVLKIAHLNVQYRTTSGMKLWAVTIDTGVMHGGSLYFDDVIVATGRAP